MNRYYVFLIAIITFLPNECLSQSLNEKWKIILNHFNASEHDSVITKVPEFINELNRNKLIDKIPIAQYHYAVSLILSGKVSAGIQAYEEAILLAQSMQGDGTVAKQLINRQVILYFDHASRIASDQPTDCLNLLEQLFSRHEHLDFAVYEQITLIKATAYRRLKNQDSLLHCLKFGYEELIRLFGNESVKIKKELIIEALESKNGFDEIVGSLLKDSTGIENITSTLLLKTTINFSGEESKYFRYIRENKNIEHIFNKYYGDIIIKDYKGNHLSLGNNAIDTLYKQVGEMKERNIPRAQRGKLLYFTFYELLVNRQDQRAWQIAALFNENDPENEEIYKLRGDFGYLFGKNDLAINSYRKYCELTINSPENKYEVLERLLDLYISGINYSDASKSIEEMDKITSLINSNHLRIRSLINRARLLEETGQSIKSVNLLFEANKLAESTQAVFYQVFIKSKISEQYFDLSQPKDGSYWLNLAEQNAMDIKDEGLTTQIRGMRATYEEKYGDKEKAKQLFEEIYQVASKEKMVETSLNAALKLGEINISNNDFVNGIVWQERAVRMALFSNDNELIADSYLRLGVVFYKYAQLDSAKRCIEKALNLLVTVRDNNWLGVNINDVVNKNLFGLGLSLLAQIHYYVGMNQKIVTEIQFSKVLSERAIQYLSTTKLSESDDIIALNQLLTTYYNLLDVNYWFYEFTGDQSYLDNLWDITEVIRARQYVAETATKMLSKINDPAVQKIVKISNNPARTIPEITNRETVILSGINRGLKIKNSNDENIKGNLAEQSEKIIQSLEQTGNKAVQLVSVNTLNRQSTISLLADNECVLNYFLVNDKLYAFLLSDDDYYVQLIPVTREELNDLVEGFRKSILDTTNSAYVQYAMKLYEILVSPFESRIHEKKVLLIPSGSLHSVPFGALFDGNLFFFEKWRYTIIPNISTLQFLRKKRIKSDENIVLCMGNPINSSVTRLPGTESEILMLRNLYSNSISLIGQSATESSIKKYGIQSRIIHIASHGIFNNDLPYLSHLALSPDEGSDGNLFLHEIYNLNLINTDIVILSACETGLAQIKKNDDMIGLVRGFMYSGVPSVIASLWKVDDLATLKFMTIFHNEYKRSDDSVESIRNAIRRIRLDEKFSHPYYWAAFSIYGRG